MSEYLRLLNKAKNGTLPPLSKETLMELGAHYQLILAGYGQDILDTNTTSLFSGWITTNDNEERAAYALVDTWIMKWPKYTGRIAYPVPCSRCPLEDVDYAFRSQRYNPDHEYGRNMLDLTRHLFSCVEREYDRLYAGNDEEARTPVCGTTN